MGVEEQVLGVADRPGGDTGRLEGARNLPAVARRRPGFDEGVELIVARLPSGEGVQARIGGQVRPRQRAAQRVPVRVAPHGDGDPSLAAGAAVDALGRAVRVAIPEAAHRPAVDGLLQDRLADQVNRHLVLGEVDVLAAAGPLALP